MSQELSQYPKLGWGYQLSRRLLGELTHVFNIQVFGKENLKFVDEQHPTIFPFFPHTGHGDSWIVHHILKENGVTKIVTEAAADYWFRNWAIALLANATMPAFPLPRKGNKAIQEAESHVAKLVIEKGYSVLLSPEGTRNQLPLEERELKTGFANLALTTESPIIPIGIYGYNNVWPRGSNLPNLFDGLQRKLVTVVIGKPEAFSINNGNNDARETRRKIVEVVKKRFIAMSKYHLVR